MSTATTVSGTDQQKETIRKAIFSAPYGDRPVIVSPNGDIHQPPSRFESNAAAVNGTEAPAFVSVPKTESDPHGKNAHQPGAKMDAGKAPIVQGVLQYFPRALKAIAMVSLAGANKYAWKGWESVPDGINRYENALGRHILAEAIEGPVDKDTQCLHKAQAAWNALAALELFERDREQQKA